MTRTARSRALALGSGAATVLALAGIAAVLSLRPGGVHQGSPATTDGAVNRSIAVLPFTTMAAGGDEEAAIFPAGMHDDLLTRLSRFEGVTVISRASVMQYSGSTRTIGEIAGELEVDTILEGVVQRAGDRVRLSVQLIDGGSDRQIWARIYDEELTAANIFSIQSDLARRIAKELRARFVPAGESAKDGPPTASLAAYDLEAQGRYFVARGTTRPLLERAVNLFERAIREDSSYAPAWAGLSRALHYVMRSKYLPEGGETHRRAREAAAKALELDDGLAAAHVAMGSVLRTERAYDAAEKEFLRAIELSPGDADAHASHGEILRDLGRHAESRERIARAVELDPLSAHVRVLLAQSLYFGRDFEGVIRESKRILDFEPDSPAASYWLGLSRLMLGRTDRAIEDLNRAWALDPLDPSYPAAVAFAHAFTGNAAAARALLDDEADRIPHVEAALVHGQLREFDAAFRRLDRALVETPAALLCLETDPAAVPLHADPRWKPFLERLRKP